MLGTDLSPRRGVRGHGEPGTFVTGAPFLLGTGRRRVVVPGRSGDFWGGWCPPPKSGVSRDTCRPTGNFGTSTVNGNSPHSSHPCLSSSRHDTPGGGGLGRSGVGLKADPPVTDYHGPRPQSRRRPGSRGDRVRPCVGAPLWSTTPGAPVATSRPGPDGEETFLSEVPYRLVLRHHIKTSFKSFGLGNSRSPPDSG